LFDKLEPPGKRKVLFHEKPVSDSEWIKKHRLCYIEQKVKLSIDLSSRKFLIIKAIQDKLCPNKATICYDQQSNHPTNHTELLGQGVSDKNVCLARNEQRAGSEDQVVYHLLVAHEL
jgi:hypothetical protein